MKVTKKEITIIRFRCINGILYNNLLDSGKKYQNWFVFLQFFWYFDPIKPGEWH